MRSEGAFIYILKRFGDAMQDGDPIFGVIRGCGLNAAGSDPGAKPLTQGRMILAPVSHAQQVLMKQTAAICGVDPLSVDYVEGTQPDRSA
jgi:acyl transferase domain-containing protein